MERPKIVGTMVLGSTYSNPTKKVKKVNKRLTFTLAGAFFNAFKKRNCK